jgi:hypothetical protein
METVSTNVELMLTILSPRRVLKQTSHTEVHFNARNVDAGGKVNIKGGDGIGQCENKKGHMNMCIITNGYRDRAV